MFDTTKMYEGVNERGWKRNIERYYYEIVEYACKEVWI